MENTFLNKIINGDCSDYLDQIKTNSIDLFLSDIPYGINLDTWDVLHNNKNSALLGSSPAQIGKSGFKKRGKPINGWSKADRNSGKEYEEWCFSWASKLEPIMKEGASLLVFGARRTLHRAINAFEDSGFILKDVLVWEKQSAHHRAQKISNIFEKRGLSEDAIKWENWRLGNLAPIYEPIAWFFKPYKKTIVDNVLKNNLGAINIEEYKTNILKIGFSKDEIRYHEAQKPLALIEALIKMTTIESQIVLDPFMGSGTTAVGAKNLERYFIGFEIDKEYCSICNNRLK